MVILHQVAAQHKIAYFFWRAVKKCVFSLAGRSTTSLTLSEQHNSPCHIVKDVCKVKQPQSNLIPPEWQSDSAATPLLLLFAYCGVPGVILIVGHGSSLASFTRPLIGLPAKDSSDFAQVVRKVRSLFIQLEAFSLCCCASNMEISYAVRHVYNCMPMPITLAFSVQRESHVVLA